MIHRIVSTSNDYVLSLCTTPADGAPTTAQLVLVNPTSKKFLKTFGSNVAINDKSE